MPTSDIRCICSNAAEIDERVSQAVYAVLADTRRRRIATRQRPT